MRNKFIALDFETADYSRTSACALGIVTVENLEITDRVSYLIKPPSPHFCFTGLHGISWNDVKGERTFAELWPEIAHYFTDIDFAVAHNMPFDRGVLAACCAHYGITPPDISYTCTLKLSRKLLNLEKNSLDRVSAHYGIELHHHEALSDTVACAKIMIEFIRTYGFEI